MTLHEPLDVPTNDLLRHIEVRSRIAASDSVFVRSISDDPEIVSVGIGVVTLFGRTEMVRDRLVALLGVLDAAIANLAAGGDRRKRFVDRGTGGDGPRWVGPIIGQDNG